MNYPAAEQHGINRNIIAPRGGELKPCPPPADLKKYSP